MSDVDENDDSGDSGEKAPKTLRDQNSKLNADNKALQEQLTKLLAADRSRTIADVLREKGANPKLARHIDRDIEGDVSETAVEKWLADEGELFGYKPKAEGDTDGDAGGDEEVDEVDADTAAQAQRVSAASSNAPAFPTGWTPERLAKASNQQLVDAGWLEPK